MSTQHSLFIYRNLDRSMVRGDSPRFRVRLRAAFTAVAGRHEDWIRAALEGLGGIEVPADHNGLNWELFFDEHSIEEVLTAIEVTVIGLRANLREDLVVPFVGAVERALSDEHLGYRLDAQGRVHLAVDKQFEADHETTLLILENPSLTVARVCYEAAIRHFDRRPQDTKAAVRSMFEALEVVAKQLVPGVNSLSKNLCRHQLRERHRADSQGDAVEQRVWGGMFEAMGLWVEAMHQYRHGQVDTEAAPTEEFAIYALSSGAAYLRLLAQLAIRVDVQPAPPEAERAHATLVPPAGPEASG